MNKASELIAALENGKCIGRDCGTEKDGEVGKRWQFIRLDLFKDHKKLLALGYFSHGGFVINHWLMEVIHFPQDWVVGRQEIRPDGDLGDFVPEEELCNAGTSE